MQLSENRKQMYIFLIILVGVSTLGLQGWRTLINNFSVDIGGLTGQDIGLVQSFREIPGFLALLTVYVLLFISEHRLAALSVAIMGIGIALTGFFPTTFGLICTTLIMSFGFHYFETMNQSLTVQYFNKTEAPIIMGKLQAVSALVNIVTGGAIWFLSMYFEYKVLFILIGLIPIGVGIWALTKNPSQTDIPMQHKKIVFHRKYWLYYILTLFAGARRQIFVAFAVFLLVEKFNYSVQAISILFVCNNIVNYFVAPQVGKAINRFGERKVLSIEYIMLTLIFITYALTDSAFVAGALYVVNNIFYNFTMGVKTFFQKIANSDDLASGVAVGFTINHIAAVVIPFLGGIAWMTDYRIVFYSAAFIAFISLIASQFITKNIERLGEKVKE